MSVCARADSRVHAGALAVDADRHHRALDRRPHARAHHLPLHVRRRRHAALLRQVQQEVRARAPVRPPAARAPHFVCFVLRVQSASRCVDVRSLLSTNHCVIG